MVKRMASFFREMRLVNSFFYVMSSNQCSDLFMRYKNVDKIKIVLRHLGGAKSFQYNCINCKVFTSVTGLIRTTIKYTNDWSWYYKSDMISTFSAI